MFISLTLRKLLMSLRFFRRRSILHQKLRHSGRLPIGRDQNNNFYFNGVIRRAANYDSKKIINIPLIKDKYWSDWLFYKTNKPPVSNYLSSMQEVSLWATQRAHQLIGFTFLSCYVVYLRAMFQFISFQDEEIRRCAELLQHRGIK